jgi:hypothetical protein
MGADYITPSDIVVSRGGLQFNVGSEPCSGPGVLHFNKDFSYVWQR